MPMSKKGIEYRNSYAKKVYDDIRLQTRKDDHIPERINAAVKAGAAKSKQAFIVQAIMTALEAAGIPEIERK